MGKGWRGRRWGKIRKNRRKKRGELGRGVELNEKREDGGRIEGRRKIRKRKNEKK